MSEITPQWMIEQGFSVTFARRFWSKVQITHSCWLWLGCVDKEYGIIGTCGPNNRNVGAHRASWMLSNGPIPEGFNVCHDCEPLYPFEDHTWSRCVNPDHLWLGTPGQNTLDCIRKMGRAIGERNGNGKLADEQVEEILQLRRQNRFTYSQIADQFNVSLSTVWGICTGETWTHVTRLHAE